MRSHTALYRLCAAERLVRVCRAELRVQGAGGLALLGGRNVKPLALGTTIRAGNKLYMYSRIIRFYPVENYSQSGCKSIARLALSNTKTLRTCCKLFFQNVQRQFPHLKSKRNAFLVKRYLKSYVWSKLGRGDANFGFASWDSEVLELSVFWRGCAESATNIFIINRPFVLKTFHTKSGFCFVFGTNHAGTSGTIHHIHAQRDMWEATPIGAFPNRQETPHRESHHEKKRTGESITLFNLIAYQGHTTL